MKKFLKALKRARMVFWASLLGTYSHSAWDGSGDYAIYNYKGKVIHVPRMDPSNIGEYGPIEHKDRYAVIFGAPLESQTIYGPFNDFEEASEYADTKRETYSWIVTLHTTDKE